jgi:hypothetical protein
MQLETVCYLYCSRIWEKGIITRLVQIQRIEKSRRLSGGIQFQEYNDENTSMYANESRCN